MSDAPASEPMAIEVIEGHVLSDRVIGPPGPSEWFAIREQAATIAATEFVPPGMRGRPEAVVAAILTGRELGIGPMASLQGIRIQDGKPAYDAELMRALVRRRGHQISALEKTHQRVTVRGKRADTGEESEVTWTLEDALIAGLIDSIDENGRPVARSRNGGAMPWEKYPRRMLFARATSELVADLFADVLVGGSYTPEEIGLAEDWDTPLPEPEPIEVTPSILEARAAIAEARDAGEITNDDLKGAVQTLALEGTWESFSNVELGAILTAARVIAGKAAEAAAAEGSADDAGTTESDAGHGADGSQDAPATDEGAEAPAVPEAGDAEKVPAKPDNSTPNALAHRLRVEKATKWTPSEGDESGDPQEERTALLETAATIVSYVGWSEVTVRKILGHDGRKDVAKALGKASLADLRAAVDLLEAKEQEEQA